MCAACRNESLGYGIYFAVGRDKSHVRGMQELKSGLWPPLCCVGRDKSHVRGMQELKSGLRPPLTG
jgi:hypothetical protein